jgi:hypothetical protein
MTASKHTASLEGGLSVSPEEDIQIRKWQKVICNISGILFLLFNKLAWASHFCGHQTKQKRSERR